MKTEQNPFNPEGIEEGDYVRLREPNRTGVQGPMKVQTVRGRFNSKLFCMEVGHELNATCFELVKKG